MVEKKQENNRLEHCFLELLKAGLWKRNSSTNGFPLNTDEWSAVLQISLKQAVLGIVYDGMMSLPSSLLPPEEEIEKWTRYIQGMERQYLSHIRMLNYLLVRYELEGGMTPALLKGLGLSSYYPDIRHRSCGDIDLFFVGDEKAEEANRLAEQWGLKVKRGPRGESEYTIKGVLVEI
ncbi:MAG: nucleotidyltransferase family protein, partial [Prevotella sp.]|nr:nucleotidyltransferase family protein [Prevotella sp.]